MKKGDRVLLNPESPFNDGDVENPINVKGTVLDTNCLTGLSIEVEWDNGEINNYFEEDLIHVLEQEPPSFDRTAIATQIPSGMMPQRQTIQIHNKKEEIVAAAIELTDELIKQLSA